MTKFSHIQNGEQFVAEGFLYMKIPAAPTGNCCDCGAGFNALVIKHADGRPLIDRYGYPVLPWASHFCPSELVEAR